MHDSAETLHSICDNSAAITTMAMARTMPHNFPTQWQLNAMPMPMPYAHVCRRVCVCVSVSNRYCVQFVAFSGVTLFFFIFSVAFTRAHTHKKAQAASEEHGEKRATSCARRNTFNILCWLSVFVVAPNGAMAVHTPNTTRQTMWQTKGIRETNTQHWMWVMQLKRDRTCSWTKPSQIYAHF